MVSGARRSLSGSLLDAQPLPAAPFRLASSGVGKPQTGSRIQLAACFRKERFIGTQSHPFIDICL